MQRIARPWRHGVTFVPMRVLVVGGGIGGLDDGAARCTRRDRRGALEQARGRSASSASGSTRCRTGSSDSPRWASSTRSTASPPHRELFYANRLGQRSARAARPRGRLLVPAALGPPRPPAGLIPRRGARAPRRRRHPRPAPPEHFEQDDDGVTARSSTGPGTTSTRCAVTSSSPPTASIPRSARRLVPRRGPAPLERRDALAGRRRLAGLPRRPLDARRGRYRREARRLPDRRPARAPTRG